MRAKHNPNQIDRLRRIAMFADQIREKLSNIPALGEGRVHFRPTASGVTMVGLLSDRPQRGKGKYSATRLRERFDAEFQKYCVEVDQGRTTPEKVLQSHLIAHAYTHGRKLDLLQPADPSGTRGTEELLFVTDELALSRQSKKKPRCDILALRRTACGNIPVLIELKSERHMKELVAQLEAYAALIVQYHPQIEAIFQAVLGEPIRLDREPEKWLVWPGPCDGPDRREAQLAKNGIGVVQYSKSDTGFVFHVGKRPGSLSACCSSPGETCTCRSTARLDLGPQSSRDSAFTARMRFHQSWYRAEILNVPCGTGPGPTDSSSRGNMLRREDAARGLNFLTPGIFDVARQRLRDATGLVEEYRLLHNMLSSQPMCFNLFGPLMSDPDLATRVFQHLFPGEVDRVGRVAFEYAPKPAGEYLNDRTAFDVYVEWSRPDGNLGFAGIETKLTEPFSTNDEYDQAAYRRWVERPGSPWPKASWERLPDIRHNQLWRDHLLAIAMMRHPQSPYANGIAMLVSHPLDAACTETTRGYQALLDPDDRSFVWCPLDQLVNVIDAVADNRAHWKWLHDFRLRYLYLIRSGAAWMNRER